VSGSVIVVVVRLASSVPPDAPYLGLVRTSVGLMAMTAAVVVLPHTPTLGMST